MKLTLVIFSCFLALFVGLVAGYEIKSNSTAYRAGFSACQQQF
jgi:hydrogenase/urease accessory protein HupE